MKKKILYVITKSNWGGAQRYVYELATSLPSSYEPVVALGGTGILAQKLSNAGVRTISLPSLIRDINPLRDLTAFWSLFFLFRREKPDVVHLNSSKIGGLGSLTARLASVPKIIFTVHGFAFNEDRSAGSRVSIKFLYWLIMQLCHETILVSEALKKQVASFPSIQQKLRVIKNGIGPVELLSRDEAREALAYRTPALSGLPGTWIGTIAELHSVKGIAYAIRALARVVKQHPDIRYVVIGEGDERPALEKIIREYELEKNVYLVGFIDEARSLLSAFDIALVPSVSEAFSIATLEAGIAELPLIASNVGGIPEIVTDGQNGLLVPPRESGAIADRIEFLLRDQTLARLIARNLAKTVRERFPLSRTVEETIAQY